jgi:hypothetical protein
VLWIFMLVWISVIVSSQVWVSVRWAWDQDCEERAQAKLMAVLGQETWDELTLRTEAWNHDG